MELVKKLNQMITKTLKDHDKRFKEFIKYYKEILETVDPIVLNKMSELSRDVNITPYIRCDNYIGFSIDDYESTLVEYKSKKYILRPIEDIKLDVEKLITKVYIEVSDIVKDKKDIQLASRELIKTINERYKI